MNLSEFNNKIYGLESGLKTGQNERVDELNDRILARFSCDVPLKPNMGVRPVPTKYSHFHMIDETPNAKINQPVYTPDNFCPIQSRGPVEGFNAGTESTLRNQHVFNDHDVFIPSSTSDLYRVSLPRPSREDIQPFLGLFSSFSPTTELRNQHAQIGNELFLNNTRTQLRNTV